MYAVETHISRRLHLLEVLAQGGARMRATSGALAGMEAMFGALDELGHQLEDLHALESLGGVSLLKLEAAVTLSRIVMGEEVDLILGEHLTLGALVAGLSAL